MIFEQVQPMQTITATEINTFFEQAHEIRHQCGKTQIISITEAYQFFYTNANAQDFGQIQSIATAQTLEKNTYELYNASGAIDINLLG